MENETIDNIYPLTVVADRYGGCYSGGKYLAFNMDFECVPEEINSDDVTVHEFFRDTELIIGKGNTITEAVIDLARKLR